MDLCHTNGLPTLDPHSKIRWVLMFINTQATHSRTSPVCFGSNTRVSHLNFQLSKYFTKESTVLLASIPDSYGLFLLLHLAPLHSQRTEKKCSKNTALTIRPATWWFQSLLEFPSHLNSRGCWGKAVKEEPCLPTLKNLQGDPVIGYSLWSPLEAGTWRLLFSAFALVQFWYNSKNKIK